MLAMAWLLVLVVTIVTFGLYAFDKWRSRRGGRRSGNACHGEHGSLRVREKR
jgi:uncharacterized membrane protein YsdA (DUF1294 family)